MNVVKAEYVLFGLQAPFVYIPKLWAHIRHVVVNIAPMSQTCMSVIVVPQLESMLWKTS